MFAGTCHAALQAATATLTHVVALLGGLDIDLDAYRAPRPDLARISLDVGDLLWSDEPLRVRARPSRENARLRAQVRLAKGGPPVARVSLRRGADGWATAEIAPLPPASYRVTVTGGPSVEPTEDVLIVVKPGVRS